MGAKALDEVMSYVGRNGLGCGYELELEDLFPEELEEELRLLNGDLSNEVPYYDRHYIPIDQFGSDDGADFDLEETGDEQVFLTKNDQEQMLFKMALRRNGPKKTPVVVRQTICQAGILAHRSKSPEEIKKLVFLFKLGGPAVCL